MKNKSLIQKKIETLPKTPGVYLMKDNTGKIVYVGKAKNLRNRVRSYFSNGKNLAYKVQKLVGIIHDFDILLVNSEVEALLLERTLIKSHDPQFNILLRDDKEFPYIRIDLKNDWPRIIKVRRKKEDGATYLGPFARVGLLNTTLQTMHRLFPLIKCKEYEFKNTTRPCNYFHMKQCLAPCVLDVERDHYINIVQSAIKFLKGENKEAIKEVQERMQKAAENEDFEQATIFRDILLALKETAKKQQVVIMNIADSDFVGIYESMQKICFHTLSVRSGIIVAHYNYFADFELGDKNNALVSFLMQFYENRSPPKEIYIPFLPEEHHEIEQVFKDGNKAPKFLVPKIGDKKALLEKAVRNAKYNIEEQNRTILSIDTSLRNLQKIANLSKAPVVIECIDISNLGETAIVGSLVSFLNGKPNKKAYRKYNINLDSEGPDDFGSIYQLTTRRLEKAKAEEEFPDLIIIDGGKGQLGAALKARKDLGLEEPPIISLAKSRVRGNALNSTDRTSERLFLDPESNPIPLTIGTPEYRLCTQIRDEAHRFAITHHRKRRKNERQVPILEKIPGVGPSLRRKLMEKFGTVESIKNQTKESLQELSGITENKAETILDFLNKEI